MKELKIIATIVAKAECDKEVYASLLKVVEGTRTESGNISYVLHRDINAPLKYVMLEHWSSQDAINLHNSSDHFQTFVKEIDGKIDSIDVVTVEVVC